MAKWKPEFIRIVVLYVACLPHVESNGSFSSKNQSAIPMMKNKLQSAADNFLAATGYDIDRSSYWHTPVSNMRMLPSKEFSSPPVLGLHERTTITMLSNVGEPNITESVLKIKRNEKHNIDTVSHVYQVPQDRIIKNLVTGSWTNSYGDSVKFSKLRNTQDNNSSNVTGNLFQVFISLYDHYLWNISTIKLGVSYDCSADMELYLRQLHTETIWALKVSDSSGRYGGQSFFGNDFWLGSKSFCHEINDENRRKDGTYNDQYIEMGFFVATIKIKLVQILSEVKYLQLGQCLPRSCSKQDVYNILHADGNAVKLRETDCSSNVSNSCVTLEIINLRNVPGPYSFLNDTRFFILSSTIVILVTTIVLASFYESTLRTQGVILDKSKRSHRRGPTTTGGLEKLVVNDNITIELSIMKKNNIDVKQSKNSIGNRNTMPNDKQIGIFSEILLCFSASSNSEAILSVAAVNHDSLTCVHGLRFYSLLWTIMVHTYLQLFAVGENRYRRKITERSFSYQIVGNATFSVDTFFFISGLLVVILFYRSIKHNRSQNASNEGRQPYEAVYSTFQIMLSVIYRFLRLTPAYLFTIIFNELALKWTYEKSVFTPGIIDHITCNKYWWRNILYINNWYPFSEMCMVWSWYLANDMQLYIIAMIVLTLSVRFIKTSTLLLMLMMIFSWVTSIFLSIYFNYSYKVSEPFESFDILYDKPWQRITPYIMGMLTGYIYHMKKGPPKVSAVLNTILWMIAVFLLLSLIFGVWDGQLSVPATALYVSLGHTAWGASLAWITLSCCWGYSSRINNLLSYRGLYPLSRLSYCAYLLHPVIMMVTSFQMEAPIHLQHVMILTVFFGNAVISFLLAYIVSLIFEAPVIRLLKILFKK